MLRGKITVTTLSAELQCHLCWWYVIFNGTKKDILWNEYTQCLRLCNQLKQFRNKRSYHPVASVNNGLLAGYISWLQQNFLLLLPCPDSSLGQELVTYAQWPPINAHVDYLAGLEVNSFAWVFITLLMRAANAQARLSIVYSPMQSVPKFHVLAH